MKTQYQNPDNGVGNPFSTPGSISSLDAQSKTQGLPWHFGGWISIALFIVSMVIPAIKHGKVVYGYECVFWGVALSFCAPPSAGAGKSLFVLSFIGTLGNVLVTTSWLHFLNIIQLKRKLRILASTMLFVALVYLAVASYDRRVLGAIYLGYWLWLGSFCMSAVFLAVEK